MWIVFFVMLALGCLEIRQVMQTHDKKIIAPFFVIWAAGLALLLTLAINPYLPRILEL